MVVKCPDVDVTRIVVIMTHLASAAYGQCPVCAGDVIILVVVIDLGFVVVSDMGLVDNIINYLVAAVLGHCNFCASVVIGIGVVIDLGDAVRVLGRVVAFVIGIALIIVAFVIGIALIRVWTKVPYDRR